MQTQALHQTLGRVSPALLERFHAVRAATFALIEPLSPEDMMVQSCSEALSLIHI